MSFGLGIDTGGTFTDAVVVDLSDSFEETKGPKVPNEPGGGKKTVLFRAKSPTTREDLSRGIAAVLRAIPDHLAHRIGMVSLSTTLATNAAVEGKGARTGLILMGYDASLFERLSCEYGLERDVTVRFAAGRHGQRGEVEIEPDWDAFRALCVELCPSVAALGISEFWGIRNPEFEERARVVARAATGLPVAVAHELSDEINALRRAATTSLNARLIPLIDELFSAVRRALDEAGINAPMMVVRGDGSLMSEAFARVRPVETLLSGPAASLVGGGALCGLEDAVVVDIGGTTTDVAIVRRGRAAMARDGVRVGAFRTGTRAVAVRTAGLGGDSLISFDRFDALLLGPRRAVPIASMAAMRPDLTAALCRLNDQGIRRTYHRGEGFVLTGRAPNTLDEEELRAVEALRTRPLLIDELAGILGKPPYFLPTERLEYLGVLTRFGLTLTDLWHITGDVALHDAALARAALDFLADRLGLGAEEFLARVLDMAGERLYRAIAEFLLDRRPQRLVPGEKPVSGDRMLRLGWEGGGEEIDVRFVSPVPLVGIGAPTHLLLPAAAHALYAQAIIPPNADVANAVGAIAGSVLAEERVHVKPHHEAGGITGYSCHSSGGYRLFAGREEAIAWARGEAARLAARKAFAMGAAEVEPVVEYRERTARIVGEEGTLLLGGDAVARAMGKARFYESAPT